MYLMSLNLWGKLDYLIVEPIHLMATMLGMPGSVELCALTRQGQYLCLIHVSLFMEQWTMYECMKDTCELNAALTRAFLKLEDDILTSSNPPACLQKEPRWSNQLSALLRIMSAREATTLK